MTQHEETIAQALFTLGAIPGRIASIAEDKTQGQLEQAPAPNEWAVHDIFAHIRAIDAIVTSRIYMILARDHPLLVDFDERRWAEIAGYVGLDFQHSLSFFTIRQQEVVQAVTAASSCCLAAHGSARGARNTLVTRYCRGSCYSS